MQRKNLTYLILLAFGFCIPIIGCGGHKEENSLHVIVLGDWGREGKEFQTQVAQQMVVDAKKHPLNLILTTGDNFYEDGVKSVTDSQWQTSYEKIYSDSSLQVPWLVSLGNHDYHVVNSPEAEIAYNKVDSKWNLPARYYAKDFKIDDATSVTFFIVDTSPFLKAYQEKDSEYHVLSQNTAAQLAWLDSALSHSKSKWKFVAGHHPIYSASPKDGNTQELVDRMLPILKKNHVNAFICGHNHNMQHFVRDGMDFYVSGGGSQAKDVTTSMPYLQYADKKAGFLDLDIASNKVTATFIDASGAATNVSTMNP